MKNFTNNFKQFTSRLSARWLIMALMMLVGTSSAWAYCTSYNGNYKVYFDASTIKFAEGKTVNLMFEKSDGSGGVTMSQVSGTRYLYLWNSSDWGSCNVTKLAFFLADGAWGWESNKLDSRKGYALAATNIHTLNSNISSNCLFSGNLTRTSNYTLPTYTITLNIVGSGSVTIKNNAGTALISGATANTSKSGVQYLTYLKNITATAANGYKLSSIKIGSTDYTSAYSSGSDTSNGYDLTGNVTITVTFEQDCITPTFTIDGLTSICEEGEYTYEIDNAVNPNATYAWTNGLLDNNNTSTGTSYAFTAGTGTKTGTISVVATDATCIYEQSIEVSQIAKVTTAGTITGTSTIEVGQTSQLSVDGASTGTASWSSDSEDVATVNANGLVTAESAGTATITYTVEPSLTGCGSTQSTTYTITVIEACEAPIVTIKDVEQLSCSSLKVTYNVTSNNGQSCGYPTNNANKIRIFDSQANAEATTLYIGSLLHTATINEDEEVTIPSNYMWTQPGGTYYVRVGAENSQGWGWSNIMEVTIPTNETLTNVTINPVDAVCKGQSTTLTLSNYSIGDIQWQKKIGDVWTNIAGATTVSYTTEALNAEMQYRIVLTDNNCNVHIQPITVSVTEPPVITSITGDDNVTIGDNVSLTANITGVYEEIEWAVEGVNSSEITTNGTSCSFVATDITTYVATATVKSASCTVSKSHNVVVNDENCAPVASKDIQITFTHPANNQTQGQWWGMGKMYNSSAVVLKDMGCNTSGSTTFTLTDVATSTISVYFEACYDWGYSGDNSKKATTKNSKITLYRGKKYSITITNGNINATATATVTGSLTQNPAITAPAVKTVSFETNPGEGDINFSGQIVKTGCDNSLTYGFEYKEVGAANWIQKVLGTDQDQNAGFAFSDNSITELDGTYVVRAFITNDHSTQYGAEITNELSTTQEPVKTASIELTTADGIPVANDKKYCVGETGYIKVTSDVKYTTIQWETDKGTEIDVNGNNGIYSFVAKGDDNIWVMLSNRHNNPESPAINENPLVINTFADPILPRVSLNKVSICSNDEVGATVKLTNVVKGQTYQLYQQIDNGDGTFTEQAIGEAKTQTEEVTDKTELVLHTLNNTYTTGKYFVKTYTSDCEENKVATQPFTFTVVDAAEVFISIEPTSAETTPWMPAKFTVNASDAYTLNVTKGNPAEPATEVEVNQNDNKVSVKIPLPEGTQHVTGQYQNVTFPQGATTQYTITATLSAAGGDNPCAAPTDATITLVPYVEECTIGH